MKKEELLRQLSFMSGEEIEQLRDQTLESSSKMCKIAWIIIGISLGIGLIGFICNYFGYEKDIDILKQIGAFIGIIPAIGWLIAGIFGLGGYRRANTFKVINGVHTSRSRKLYWLNFLAGLYITIFIFIFLYIIAVIINSFRNSTKD